MRIAIVINTSWNIFNFRKGLVLALMAEGHEVVAIAPKDAYSEKLVELGCTFLPIEMENKGTNPIKDLGLYFQLKKQYKESGADLFLQYTIKPNIYGTMAAKAIGKPVICNVSGLGTIFIHPTKISSRVGFGLYKRAFKYPNVVFFQNPDDQHLFVDMGLVQKKTTAVLPGSGVDLTHFKNESEFSRNAPFRFLMVARVLKDKGTVEFAEAAQQLKAKYGDKVECVLLGKKDNSRGSVSDEVFEKWQDQNWIKYLGETDDVKSIVQSADCVVLPSYREGTPKTLLEAMALSKPIITTDAPGCKETVINDKNGYICKVKSSDDLHNKMIQMIELEDVALQQMGTESRRLAEKRFDEKIVIGKYLEKINEI